MVGSGSPAPHFVNNDYVAAEIVSSTAHARREVLDQLRASVSCSTPGRLLASVCAVTPDELRMKALQLLLWGYTGVTPRLCHVRLWYGSVMAMLWLCCGCCYGCCVSQERRNVSAVPVAPQVFVQPLCSHLACTGFSQQYEQQDNCHSEQRQ